MSDPALVTFVIYLVLLLGIGLYFYRRSTSIEDYLLGGRRMGSVVTALSGQAITLPCFFEKRFGDPAGLTERRPRKKRSSSWAESA